MYILNMQRFNKCLNQAQKSVDNMQIIMVHASVKLRLNCTVTVVLYLVTYVQLF